MEDELRNVFSPYGEVLEVQMVYEPETGEPRGEAHIQFSDVDSSTRAGEAVQGAIIRGHRIILDYAKERRASPVKATLGSTSRIFVGNLPPGTTKKSLLSSLPSLPKVESVRVAQSGLYAHIAFADVPSSEEAFGRLKGSVVGGRHIRLDFAVERGMELPIPRSEVRTVFAQGALPSPRLGVVHS